MLGFVETLFDDPLGGGHCHGDDVFLQLHARLRVILIQFRLLPVHDATSLAARLFLDLTGNLFTFRYGRVHPLARFIVDFLQLRLVLGPQLISISGLPVDFIETALDLFFAFIQQRQQRLPGISFQNPQQHQKADDVRDELRYLDMQRIKNLI